MKIVDSVIERKISVKILGVLLDENMTYKHLTTENKPSKTSACYIEQKNSLMNDLFRLFTSFISTDTSVTLTLDGQVLTQQNYKSFQFHQNQATRIVFKKINLPILGPLCNHSMRLSN